MPITTDIITIPFVQPPEFTGDPETWSRLLNKYLIEQLFLLQSLTGGNLRWQNLRSQLTLNQAVPAGTAPITINLNHTLGAIPSVYVVMPVTPQAIAALDWSLSATVVNRAAWTATSIQLTYEDTTHALNPAVNYDLWLLA